MPLHTKRWDDDLDDADGTRILVCRYRPRGLKKEFETWSAWHPQLGPSPKLHAAAYGKNGLKIDWQTYARLYLHEMRAAESQALIHQLAERLRAGETLTLLCSSACTRESRCHRSLLAELIEQAANSEKPNAIPPTA